ncbi:hypothetical protein BM525_03790 [Alteromonas mediterranea]|jgi:hypothetical protein|uniref:Uncharacterized protein n=1 Tax=Alteromonas mediterranea TaxID=314275 RepID=A0AAC9J826_9ALTE|nr:hypothetical protein [Alteromonas mediterranea]APD89001.1 hypothetical protein BM524_03775 [Alteromonas mediterranea]APD96818.1 hypothetical protein BM525_03790 [Alteromonas mediterranea]
MEPITTAIIAALTSGVCNTTQSAVSDAYNCLKQRLTTLFSDREESITEVINAVEANPESLKNQTSLNDKLAQINIVQHQEILLYLNQLLNQLQQSESGKKALQKYTVKAEKVGVIGDNVNIDHQSF